MLFDFDPAHNPVAFPSPRSWEFAHRALQKFGTEPSLLLDTLKACVGAAAGIELHAFINNLERLPDLDAIVRGEEVAAPLAQFAPEVGQQFHRPHQRPPDPASQHAPVDVHRVVVEPGFQRRQREPLGDEHADRGKDLAEGRGLVGHVRAGEDAREAAVTAGQLLDPDGMLAIPRGTAAPAVSPKRADAGHDDGVNQPDPAGYLRLG